MRRRRVLGIRDQDRNQQLRVENVHAHRGVAFCRVETRRGGVLRLFLEAGDAPVSIGFDNPELPRRFFRFDLNRRYGDVRSRFHMLLKHLAVIHFVDVVAGKNHHIAGALAADGINVLVDGIRSALIPALRNTHLRGNNFVEFTEARQTRPAIAHVPVQAQGLVLSQHEHAAQIGIEAVGKRDVNNAVHPAEGHGRLGAVAGQRPQTFPLPAGQQYAYCVAHRAHGSPVPPFYSGAGANRKAESAPCYFPPRTGASPMANRCLYPRTNRTLPLTAGVAMMISPSGFCDTNSYFAPLLTTKPSPS